MASLPQPESEGVSLEWGRLRALRRHHGRLKNQTRYRSMDESEARKLKRKKTMEDETQHGLDNALKSFDVGFRQILLRNDLDIFFNGALDKEAMDQAQPLLSALCQQLERIVNTDILKSSLTPSLSVSKYKNLDSLIKYLDESEDEFDVINGSQTRLFRAPVINEARKARDIVDSFNAYFSELTSPELREAGPLSDHRISKTSGAGVGQYDLTTALRGLTALLKNLPQCPSRHNVLLQLANLDISRSEKSRPDTVAITLDLLVSICHKLDKSCWQECYLYTFLPRDQKAWDIRGLCQEIRDATSGTLAVHLAAHKGHVSIVNATDDIEIRPSPRGKCTPITLKNLLQNHAFTSPQTPSLHGYCSSRFNDEDKKLLAIRLVSSLILSLDSGQILKCWDPAAIYFPSPSNGEYLPTLPYALSVLEEEIKSTIQGSSNPSVSDLELEDILFPQLAKLLFEIKFGYTRDDIYVDDQSRGPNSVTLEGAIRRAIEIDLSSVPFLDVIDICRTFRQQCVEIKRERRGKYPDEILPTATFRQLALAKIVQRIEGTAVAWEMPPISSSDDQLGFSNGLPVELLPGLRSDNDNPARRKRARLHEGSAGKTEPGTAVGSLHDIEGKKSDAWISSGFFQNMGLFQSACDEYIHGIETRNLRLGQQEPNMVPRPKVRIAVLDTGISMNHRRVSDAFSEGRMSYERCRNWTREANGAHYPEMVYDSNGHGTKVVELLTRISPDAEICIAKVFESNIIKISEAKYVAEAINHAADMNKWNADIIVMSFSLDAIPRDDSQDELSQYRAEITKEIEARQDKIFIAAAGNDGRNKPRSFPANMMSSNVICMHASHGDGSTGNINPSPTDFDDNFMTLGMDIEFEISTNAASPNQDEPEMIIYKSGTSWATIIAAGIAANILRLVDAMDFNQETQKNLRKGCVMKKMFRNISEGPVEKYRYIAPWVKLWPAGWEKSEAAIRIIEAGIHIAAHT